MDASLKGSDLKKKNQQIKRLYDRYKSIVVEGGHNSERIEELNKENKNILQSLQLIQKEHANWEAKNEQIQQKLSEAKETSHADRLTYFKKICKLIGFNFVSTSWNEEHQVKFFKCYYSEDCYMRLGISSIGQIDLLEISPCHPNFSNIREFLQTTQDASGFLNSMLNYFKCIENNVQSVSAEC